MITTTWYETLPGDDLTEVRGLLEEAAEHDEEAGFSTAVPDARSPAGGTTRHLVVTIPPRGQRESPHLDRLPDVRVVAYLRLDVVAGAGTVQLVVRPDFRSLGVATLLFELLAVEPDGWRSVPDLRVLRAWAHGEHPAAHRMKQRFGGQVVNAVFKTLRPVGGNRPFRGEGLGDARRDPTEGVPDIAEGHGQTLAPGDRAVLARARTRIQVADDEDRAFAGVDPTDPAGTTACVAFIRSNRSTGGDAPVGALLSQALLDVQQGGARIAQLYVDALDEAFVAASRELQFVHDQSDVLYTLRLDS